MPFWEECSSGTIQSAACICQSLSGTRDLLLRSVLVGRRLSELSQSSIQQRCAWHPYGWHPIKREPLKNSFYLVQACQTYKQKGCFLILVFLFSGPGGAVQNSRRPEVPPGALEATGRNPSFHVLF